MNTFIIAALVSSSFVCLLVVIAYKAKSDTKQQLIEKLDEIYKESEYMLQIAKDAKISARTSYDEVSGICDAVEGKISSIESTLEESTLEESKEALEYISLIFKDCCDALENTEESLSFVEYQHNVIKELYSISSSNSLDNIISDTTRAHNALIACKESKEATEMHEDEIKEMLIDCNIAAYKVIGKD